MRVLTLMAFLLLFASWSEGEGAAARRTKIRGRHVALASGLGDLDLLHRALLWRRRLRRAGRARRLRAANVCIWLMRSGASWVVNGFSGVLPVRQPAASRRSGPGRVR